MILRIRHFKHFSKKRDLILVQNSGCNIISNDITSITGNKPTNSAYITGNSGIITEISVIITDTSNTTTISDTPPAPAVQVVPATTQLAHWVDWARCHWCW